MAVTHPTPVRDGICNHVVDQLDEGTPPGKLIMQTSGSSNVAQLVLSTTAFGASTNGIATAAAITPSSNLTSAGTIAKAVLNNAAGSNKILCSVTATGGGGDIELNSVIVSDLQEVSISSLTYAAPA